MSPLARQRWVVVATRLAADAVAWATGFRAVSDDDFSRVVIAQGFAHAPSLDPSGTSWLPLPFWLTGGTMMILGRDLWVARAHAVGVGIVASLLLFEAGRRLFGEGRRAMFGTVVATLLPWGARLGIAMVPELLTAALTVYALSTTTSGASPRARLAGAAAIAAACLSRYEPWFVAAPFAAISAADALRGRQLTRRDRGSLAAAALTALAAPCAWMAWNRHAHGDALAFVARVASYKRAIGGEAAGLYETAKGTLISLLTAEPELWCAAVVTAAVAAFGARGASSNVTFRRPLVVLAIATGALVVAGARDGAPTHHPERALLATLLFAAVLVGGVAVDRVARIRTPRAALGVAATSAVIVTACWFVRHWWWPVGAFAAREAEVAAGRAAAALSTPGQPVLVEVSDYGYFAVIAGSGRPEDFVPDRSIDPRVPNATSSFADAVLLERRATGLGAAFVVGRRAILGARCLAPREGAHCVAAAGPDRGPAAARSSAAAAP